MRKIKVILGISIFSSFILTSWQEKKSNESTNSTEENSSLNETQSPEPEPLKQIEWKDGKPIHITTQKQ